MNGALALFPEHKVVVKQLSLLTDEKIILAPPISLESVDADFEKVGQFCRIANGDCLNYMKVIPTNSVDLIQTDPPYNLGLFMQNRQTNLNKMRENHFAYAGWDGCNSNCRYAAIAQLKGSICWRTKFHRPLIKHTRRFKTCCAPFILHRCPDRFKRFCITVR